MTSRSRRCCPRGIAATPPDPDDDTDPGWLFTTPVDDPESETE